ncbi:MAG: LTA synthase family protein [Lachnospiraceae bacterium]|nr:LTA synthase family protein [Lachnospiraceae bacterium]
MRMMIVFVFLVFGIINCIVLLNRVSPFGFTDITMIGDLLTMQNTNYFTKDQATVCVIAIAIYLGLMVLLFFKGKVQTPRLKLIPRAALIAVAWISMPLTTYGMQETGLMASYFGNLAQGYLDYGYLYGFATSMLDLGMRQPRDYNDATIKNILKETDMGETSLTTDQPVNVVVILLESMFDVSEADFIETSEDPIPYLHYLEENFSYGHLTVPVVGAGTCNSEFEVLTGMSCQFFGPGEYPQKTILKETDCESVADVFKETGYGTHVVHNNGGNFYSRRNAFSMMGFDSFTSKEMLDITEYTPLGTWPIDDILIDSTADALDTTPGADFVYTITVEAHGDYPTEVVEENPVVKVKCKGKDQAKTNQWTYYINRIYNVDDFIKKYTEMFEQRGEPTLVIMFGDHLPTMGLNAEEVKQKDLYQTKYWTWNNFGMEKIDQDLTSYQLVPTYMNRLGIHGGTVTNYNQAKTAAGISAKSHSYIDGLEMLQYDILYGDRYVYDGEDGYPASDIVMGTKDIKLDRIYHFNNKLYLYGDQFTKWSRVYVNDEKVSTSYQSGQCLTIDENAVKDGDTIVVNQVGSSSTIFRSSNAVVYYSPDYVPESTTNDTADSMIETEEKTED